MKMWIGHRTLSLHRILGLIVMCCAMLAGGPATKQAGSLDGLERAFASQAQALGEQYKKQLIAAEEDRLRGLKLLLDHAMETKDLDNAISLRDRIKSVEAEIAAVPMPSTKRTMADDNLVMERRLKDTLWEWGAASKVKFQSDGTVGNSEWTSSGLVTTWKVIDRHTVLLFIERGRNENRYAVLTFSPELDSFTGFGFEGKAIPRSRSLK